MQVIHLSNPFLDGNQSSVDGSDSFEKASIGHRTSSKEGTGQKMRNRDRRGKHILGWKENKKVSLSVELLLF